MFVVVTETGGVMGPFMTLAQARTEAAYSRGRIYLLQGPVQ